MPKLLVQQGADKGKVHVFNAARITIGRSVNNEVQVVDRRMSRNHSEIFLKDGGFYVRDLGSKNGTLLNGTLVSLPVKLRSGDLITIGDSTMLFEDESNPVSSGDLAGLNPSTSTGRKKDASSFRVVEENQWGLTQGELRAGVSPPASVSLDADSGKNIKDTTRRLEIIYQVTEAIRSLFDLDELLERIMEIVTDVFHPDRAYLLLAEEETGELTPMVIKVRNGDDREVKISRSIAHRCMNEGISLLVSDAASDDRFSASESIILNRIRTAMVAPLIYKSEVLGIVYIDTRTRMAPFQREELELLTGVTNQAAMAIINARLHGQLIEQHKVAREMEIARTIQMNLLPKVYPDLPGFEISAMSLPAKQVGGDYYDFVTLPDARHCLTIADVSGKGVPAAILTATTRSYFQSETQHPGKTLTEVVARINRMVHRDVTNDMYVTMAMLYLDPTTGVFEYVNAGHSHPILMDRLGQIRFLEKGGLFLGIIEDSTYESAVETMEPGDVLVLDTDGVTDIQNVQGIPFGAERLYDLLRQNRHLSAEQIRNVIYQACLQHRGDADQFDDFTLIVLKRIEVDDLHEIEDADFDMGDH